MARIKISRGTFKKLKRVLPLGTVTIFSLFLLLWLVPFSTFDVIRSSDFTSSVFSFWFVFIGLLFISLGVIALPSVKNTAGRIASLFLIGFGAISLIFSGIAITEGINEIAGNSNLRFMAIILFTGGTIILIAELIARTVTRKGKGVPEVIDNM